MDTRTYLNYWAELYKTDMLTNIMPFWLRYGVDKEHGGGSKDVLHLPAATPTTILKHARNGLKRPNLPSTSSKNIVLTATDVCISK